MNHSINISNINASNEIPELNEVVVNNDMPELVADDTEEETDDDMPGLVADDTEEETDDDMPGLVADDTEEETDDDMPELVTDNTDDNMPELVTDDTEEETDDDMPELVTDNTEEETDDDMPDLVAYNYLGKDCIQEPQSVLVDTTNQDEVGLLLLEKTDKFDTIRKRIPISTIDGNITTVAERDESLNEMVKPLPYRLVMISTTNNCQFCKNPHGQSYIHNIDIDTHFGFISCEKCREHGKEAVREWLLTYAYGRVAHLQTKKIKIRRTNVNKETGTDIEDGWELNNPLIIKSGDIEYVQCCNKELNLERYCSVDSILELNS